MSLFRSPRKTYTYASALAGCYDCNGSEYMWDQKNAVAVAARHHDATGHHTWADQALHIEYGDGQTTKWP